MAHFFVSVCGSKIHERVAHFFVDIYIDYHNNLLLVVTDIYILDWLIMLRNKSNFCHKTSVVKLKPQKVL